MKTIFLFLISFSLSLVTFAQDSWKIVHNGKQKIATSTETTENVISITKEDLDPNGFLFINYTEATKPQEGWRRVVALVDDAGNEIYKHGGNLMHVRNPSMRSFFNNTKRIDIYTWSLPTDPKLAATVKVRRVHLCTLTLQ